MLGALILLFGLMGCGEKQTEFDIVNIRGVGDVERFRETFDECYYSVSGRGRVDLVARRRSARSEAAAPVSQIVHVRTAYRAIPGVTHADSTMINATVHYAILDGIGGTCYEGAGFLSTHENRAGTVLTGEIEHATLARNRHVGSGGEIFDRAELTGPYRATKNRRKVVALLNELNRLFGPQPDYHDKPPSDPL